MFDISVLQNQENLDLWLSSSSSPGKVHMQEDREAEDPSVAAASSGHPGPSRNHHHSWTSLVTSSPPSRTNTINQPPEKRKEINTSVHCSLLQHRHVVVVLYLFYYNVLYVVFHGPTLGQWCVCRLSPGHNPLRSYLVYELTNRKRRVPHSLGVAVAAVVAPNAKC